MTKCWSKSREGDLYAGQLVRLTSLPPLWCQRGSCIDADTVNCFTTGRRRLPLPLQSIDGVCSLFLSLPWSANLSVERGEPFALTTIS